MVVYRGFEVNEFDVTSEGDWTPVEGEATTLRKLSIPVVEPIRAVTVLDATVATLALPIVLPAIGACWLAIKASDWKADAFYVQTRYGLGGKPFKMIKLRTMVPNADDLKADLIDMSEDKGPGFKIKNDPRITPLGRILRKTHLDELPQFFNVFKGEMSIVGPRANSFHPREYETWQLKRLSVKPGMTGSWQISKNKPQNFSERTQMDIDYIESRSLFGDIGIILKTAWAVAFRAPGD